MENKLDIWWVDKHEHTAVPAMGDRPVPPAMVEFVPKAVYDELRKQMDQGDVDLKKEFRDACDIGWT